MKVWCRNYGYTVKHALDNEKYLIAVLHIPVGVEVYYLEDLLVPWVTIFSFVLFVIAIVSYNRTRNKRLIFVTCAFALFFIKGIILTIGLYFPSIISVHEDPLLLVMDILLLLSLYFGILRKDARNDAQA
ncbi:MAG: hypothetical protein QXT63_02855 [Thermoplasmata archaeon]